MINVITYSAVLSNNLTNKILVKFQESVDTFLDKISNTYRQDIKYLSHNTHKLQHTNIEKYADGSIKNPTNYWDLLNQEDKEEAISLMELQDLRLKEIRTVRKYLTSLASKCLIVDDTNKIISYDLTSYVKFFNCLPDFITQDRDLLLAGVKGFELTEEDLTDIERFGVTHAKVDSNFIIENKNEEVDKILSSLYALEFLMDF